jgi:hypothetical protein
MIVVVVRVVYWSFILSQTGSKMENICDHMIEPYLCIVDLWNCIQVSKAMKVQFGRRLFREFKRRFEKRLNVILPQPPPLSFLTSSFMYTGSLVLSTILDEVWEGQDVDVCVPLATLKRELGYDDTSEEAWFLQLDDDWLLVRPDKQLSKQFSHLDIYAMCCIRAYFKEMHVMDMILVDDREGEVDVIPEICQLFDITACGVVFTSTTLYIPDAVLTFSKRSRIKRDLYSGRASKYMMRGFDLLQPL